MRIVNRLFALCCAAVALTCLLAISGDAQERPDDKLSFDVPVLESCELKRSPAGVYTLHIIGHLISEEASFTINGNSPKKVKFKGTVDNVPGRLKIVMKGAICGSLPGFIIATNPDGRATAALACNQRCRN